MWSVGARVEVQWADGYQSVEDAPPVEAVGMTAEDEPLQLAGHDEPWAARAAETAGAAEVAASDQEEVTASASNSRKRARVTFEQHNIAMPLPTCTKAFDLGEFGTVLAQAAPATVRWQEAAAAARQRAIQQGQPTLLLLGDAFRLPNRTWRGYAHGSSPCVLDGYVEKFAWDDGPGPAYIVRTVEDGWHYPFPPDKLAEHAAITPPAMPSSSSTADVEVEVQADPWEEEVLEPGDAWVAFDCAAVAAAEQRRRQQGQEDDERSETTAAATAAATSATAAASTAAANTTAPATAATASSEEAPSSQEPSEGPTASSTELVEPARAGASSPGSVAVVAVSDDDDDEEQTAVVAYKSVERMHA